MAERQYVGARYVPKFAEPYEWDINLVYEPLTIVGLNGNAYTSKKRVPAGIQISNTEYWALTSYQSGAIETLQQDIAKLSTIVTDLDPQIEANEESINKIETELNKKADISSVESIAGKILVRENAPFGVQNVVIIGDDYATPNSSWARYLMEQWNVPTTNYVISAVNGAGFGTLTNSFNSLLQAVANSKEETWRNKVSHIIVAGGINDYSSSPSTTEQQFKAFEATARLQFKNASIFCANIARKHASSIYGNWFKMNQYYEIYSLACNFQYCYGVYSALALLDNINCITGIPTASGQLLLARHFTQAICCGSAWISTLYYNLTIGNQTWYEGIMNGTYRIYCPYQTTYTFPETLSDAGAGTIPFESNFVIGAPTQYVTITTSGAPIPRPDNYVLYPLTMSMTQGNLYCRWSVRSNATQLIISPFSHVEPFAVC